jgi:hypothetical protein
LCGYLLEAFVFDLTVEYALLDHLPSCNMWPSDGYATFIEESETPADNLLGGSPLVLGTRFRSLAIINVTAIRFYKARNEVNTKHDVFLYDASTGDLLVSETVSDTCPGEQWVSMLLSTPFTTAAAGDYVVAVDNVLYYPKTKHFFAAPRDVGALSAVSGAWGTRVSAMPNNYDTAYYWVDREYWALRYCVGLRL